jgi:UTP:GlnB (protein PII) uridylyltransferase
MVVSAGQPTADDGTIVDVKIVSARDQFEASDSRRPARANRLETAITVGNVSLIAKLRNQFNRLLPRMTVDTLLTLMLSKYGNPGGEA